MNLDWDEVKDPRIDALVSSAKEYAELDARIKELSERKAEVVANIVSAYFPSANEAPGEWKRVVGNAVITVNRGERWTWNSKMLEEKFGIEPPAYVKRSYGCDKRQFEKLSPEQQNEIIDALTKNLGTLKIDVEVVEE